MATAWIRAVLVLGLCGAAVRAEIFLVKPGGPLTSIQQAVDLAHDGDIVFIEGPWYGADATTTIDHGVFLMGMGTQYVGRIVISHVPQGETVGLLNLTINQNDLAPDVPALTLEDDPGSVRVENCFIKGHFGDPGSTGSVQVPKADGGPAVTIHDCADVNFHRCNLAGGEGGAYEIGAEAATNGGAALVASDSLVSLHECTVDGGPGGNAYDGNQSGASGGAAVRNEGATIHLESCSMKGGDAGHLHCDGSGCGTDGTVGSGVLSTQPSSLTRLRGGTIEAGHQTNGSVPPGLDVVVLDGSVVEDHAPVSAFIVPSPLFEQWQDNIYVSGVPGDVVFLLVSSEQFQKYMPGHHGVLLLADPQILHVPLAVITSPFSIPVPVTAPNLPPGLDSLTGWLQIVVQHDGKLLLGPAASLTVLSASAGL